MGEVKDANGLSVVDRYKAPTPPFFNKLAWIGGIIAAIGAALTQAELIDLNPIFEQIGGYCVVAGAVLTAVAKATVNTVSS